MIQQILNHGYLHLIAENYFTQMIIDRSVVLSVSDVKILC